MNTKLKVSVAGNETVVGHNHWTLPGNGYEITMVNAVNDETIHDAPKTERTMVTTIGMFLAAPFIALGYVIALPFVGFFMLTRLAMEAHRKGAYANS